MIRVARAWIAHHAGARFRNFILWIMTDGELLDQRCFAWRVILSHCEKISILWPSDAISATRLGSSRSLLDE